MGKAVPAGAFEEFKLITELSPGAEGPDLDERSAPTGEGADLGDRVLLEVEQGEDGAVGRGQGGEQLIHEFPGGFSPDAPHPGGAFGGNVGVDALQDGGLVLGEVRPTQFRPPPLGAQGIQARGHGEP